MTLGGQINCREKAAPLARGRVRAKTNILSNAPLYIMWLAIILACIAGNAACFSTNTCFRASLDSGHRPLELIGGLIRPDRIALTNLYRPFFAGQAFFLTGADPVIPRSFRNASELANFGVSDFVDCTQANPQVYVWCFGLFLKNLSAGRLNADRPCTVDVPVSGVLYHHFDMWVNPFVNRGTRSLNHANVWFAGHGMSGDMVCKSGEALLQDGWHWWYDSRATGARALERIRAAAETGHALACRIMDVWPSGQLCRGHADIYYVPARYFEDVAQLAAWFHDVHHEAAWATMLHMVAGKTEATPWGVTEDTACCDPRWDIPNFEQLDCFYRGDWNVTTSRDLLMRQCGHRLLLQDPMQRMRLAEALLPGTIT